MTDKDYRAGDGAPTGIVSAAGFVAWQKQSRRGRRSCKYGFCSAAL